MRNRFDQKLQRRREKLANISKEGIQIFSLYLLLVGKKTIHVLEIAIKCVDTNCIRNLACPNLNQRFEVLNGGFSLEQQSCVLRNDPLLQNTQNYSMELNWHEYEGLHSIVKNSSSTGLTNLEW